MALALSALKLATLPPNTGQRTTRAVSRPGQLHVDAELARVPLTFSGTSSRGSDWPSTLNALRILQRDGLRHRQRRGLVHQRAVLRAASARLMDDLALVRRQRVLGNAPGLRRGGDEHRARGRARLAQHLPHAAHAVAAGGELLAAEVRVAVLRVGAGPLGLDLRPVEVELLGDEHRHRRHHALPHLEHRQHDAHGVVGVDLDPDVGLEACRRPLRDRASPIGEIRADHQAAAGGGGGLEEGASRECRWSCHRASS